MNNKQKLELTWIGKQKRPLLEPRILLEEPDNHYHASHIVSDNDIFDNMLIHGDNLLALKALEQQYTGKIKCIFIDPPYNTGSAFAHYDDGVEHSLWLGLMRDRIELLHRLLSENGSFWVTLDDNESHYFKVMCDEIFGRNNFVANVIWQKKYAPANDAKWLSDDHDHVLVYAKDKQSWRPRKLPRTAAQNSLYKNPDNDPRGDWMSDNYTCAKSADERPNLYYAITNPNTGEEIWPKKTRVWAFDPSAHKRHVEENLIYWGKDGKNSTPRLKKFISLLSKGQGRVSSTIWTYEEVGHTQDARREVLALNSQDPFSTPKPERLIRKILELATEPNDLVLDSFAGSGTTGAVAHKMRRRWIMVELGNHCFSHIIPRLQGVIDGNDKGGATELDWKGGGGFKCFRLAPTLLERDRWGNLVINNQYNAVMLAQAVCKHMGFTYAPNENHYFIHGYSSESDLIYVTTASLTHAQIKAISEELGENRTLLICCKAFKANADVFSNITITKIPTALLKKCEWGRDDYSLNINNLQLRPDVSVDEAMSKQLSLALSGAVGDKG